MILKKFMTVLVLGSIPLIASFAADKPTLGDFLQAFPEVANFKASSMCYHCAPEKSFAHVRGIEYEVRYVTFTDGHGSVQDKTFKEFIDGQDLSQLDGKEAKPNPFSNVYFFNQPKSCEEKGVYFTLSFKTKD